MKLQREVYSDNVSDRFIVTLSYFLMIEATIDDFGCDPKKCADWERETHFLEGRRDSSMLLQ